MAYNILKGAVEGSVDQHADQHIEGVKVFKSTISASVFYDTDAGAACVTSKDVAISAIDGGTANSIITMQESSRGKAYHNLTFDGNALNVPVVNARELRGSGENLTNLPANSFNNLINADSLNLGENLQNVRGALQANLGSGLHTQEGQIAINLANNGALSLGSGKLSINLTQLPPVNAGGQNLSDDDVLLVRDTSRGSTMSTTLGNLYNTYITSKLPKASGKENEIQLKGKKGFASSSKLSYDTKTETLNVGNRLSTRSLQVDSSLSCNGAVTKNIGTITERTYEVGPSDYTLVCDTVKNPITVTVPPACNHTGRIIVIKKSNTDKYNLRSYPVRIVTLEGTIDLNDEQIIKTNYSARTLQSDGTNWHIIGSKGS